MVGLFLGGLLGSATGLFVGANRYIESNVVITRPDAHHAADRSQLSAGEGSDTADDDASDPRVAWPLFGLVFGSIVGVSAGGAYNQLLRLFGEAGHGA